MAFFRSVAKVGLFTLISRFLGFVRDLLLASLLGASPIADAFVIAQRLPNAFRAIFAEGAMDTAFVPIYTRKKQSEQAESVQEFVNHIFTILVFILLPMTVLALVFMPAIVNVIAPGFSEDPLRFKLAVTYSRICFGFLFLISLTALQGGLLNANGNFIPLASAPAIFNVVMIFFFLGPVFFDLDPGLCGSWSMIAGGVAQLIVLHYSCRRMGLKLHFAKPQLTKDVRQFFKLVGPGIIGAGADQLNVLVSSMLASSLPAGAIAALYYADRLSQLPLGVIGGAIATALLPALAKHIAAREDERVVGFFSRALELALILCLPATLVLVIEPEDIVYLLFQHGVFNADNTRITAETIMAYAFTIPGYSMVRIFVTRFYAHEDTRTPLLVAFASITFNFVLAYLLRERFQHIGIAAGLSLTEFLNAFLLWVLLFKRGHARIDADAKRRLPRIALSAAIFCAVLFVLDEYTDSFWEGLFGSQFLGTAAALTAAISLSTIVYALALHFTGGMRRDEFKALFRHT